jgi:hypothetical protein
MTVRASKFPECLVNEYKEKRRQWAQEHLSELLISLCRENEINMINIRNGNPRKQKERSDKYQAFFPTRVIKST